MKWAFVTAVEWTLYAGVSSFEQQIHIHVIKTNFFFFFFLKSEHAGRETFNIPYES